MKTGVACGHILRRELWLRSFNYPLKKQIDPKNAILSARSQMCRTPKAQAITVQFSQPLWKIQWVVWIKRGWIMRLKRVNATPVAKRTNLHPIRT